MSSHEPKKTKRTFRIWRRGFTLLEIVTVVAVIGILGAILLSVFSKSRASARRAQCDTHLKAIALALDAFRQEIDHFPSTLLELQNGKYITDATLLACPDDPRAEKSYEDFYVLRAPRDRSELPILVCPFHEKTNHGLQAYRGKYTTQFMVSPAILTTASRATVEHPGKAAVSAPVGLELRGADIIRTDSDGSATVTFADGSYAMLGQNTEMTILQSFTSSQTSGPLYSLVNQDKGSVNYRINSGSKFDIVTPTATAGALGTAFEIRIDPKNQTTWLNVENGAVRFNTLAGESEVINNTWIATSPPPPPPQPPPTGPPPPRPPPPRPGPGGGQPPPP